MTKRNDNIEEIPLVPVELIDPPWDLAIDNTQAPFTHINICTQAEQNHLSRNDTIYVIALHWLFKKKWRSSHKIPGKRLLAKAIEPLGEFFYQLLNICTEAHLVEPFGYKSAAEWFEKVVLEMRKGDVNEILSPSPKGTGKEKHCKAMWKEISELKEGYNPYKHIQKEFPHTYQLVEVTLSLKDKSDIFSRKHFAAFISSYSNWARELHKNPVWQVFTIENGQLFVRSGRGRGKQKVS